MKTIIVVVSFVALTLAFGCVALSEQLTPANLSQQAKDYALEAGVVEPDSLEGYQNLHKVGILAGAVDDAHELNQFELSQLIDKDRLFYTQLSDTVRIQLTAARQQEELLFGEKGLLTMGLGLAGFGGLTGLIGLMRKRPGDITPEELKKAVSGKDATITERETQVIELVKGVQEFIDNLPKSNEDAVRLKELKRCLDGAQSAKTKMAVGCIKATL